VRAAIEQRADLAVRVPQQDERPQAQPHSDVVVVRRDLALVTEIDPDRAEDVRHLRGEDGRIGVNYPMDAILLHEFVPVVEVGALDSRCVELLQHGLRPLEDRYQLRLLSSPRTRGPMITVGISLQSRRLWVPACAGTTPREWRDRSFRIRL